MTLQQKNSTNGRAVKSQLETVNLAAPADSTLLNSERAEPQNGHSLSPSELAEIWAKRAHDLAAEPVAEAIGQTMDLLVFWLGGECYGFEVGNVREIFSSGKLTPVPRTPNFVVGVFNARGHILSVIDLRAFFGLSAPSFSSLDYEEVADQSKIIVVTTDNRTSASAQMEVGILANEVDDVITIFKADLEPVLTTQGGVHAEYVHGITNDMLTVLNLERLLQDERLIIHDEVS